MKANDLERLAKAIEDVDYVLGGGEAVDELREAWRAVRETISFATPELVEKARRLYARGSDDDVEVDDDALASEGDNGVWVQGWLWIPAPYGEEEPE